MMNILRYIVLTLFSVSICIAQSESDKEDLKFEDIHLVASISNENPKVNEPITLTYKLYVSYSTGVNNWNKIKESSYTNFISEPIDLKQIKIEYEKYNGKKYRCVVIKKTILTSNRVGEIEIEPLTLDVSLEVPSKERDEFGALNMIQKKKQLHSNRIVVNVKPPLKK